MNIRNTILIILFITVANKTLLAEIKYDSTFIEIESMLSGKESLDFKKAVFLTENTYFENQIDESVFNNAIHFYTSISKGIMKSGNIVYPDKDSLKAAAQTIFWGLNILSSLYYKKAQ